MAGKPTTKTLAVSAAQATVTGWVPLDVFVSDVQVGYTIEAAGPGEAPVVNVEATMQNVLASGSVASTEVFAIASAVATSAIGTNVAAGVAFQVNAIRLATISGGSGANTLTFRVLQSGPGR